MSSSAPPPPCSNRTSSDVTALVAELARVIKGRRFYGPGSTQLARLFERALRVWQAELGRHGDLEIRLEEDGLRVPGLPTAAFAGEFSTLRGMLDQRDVRSLRVEAALDADGFAALLEVLVSDAAKLAREGGVESALYARAPVGFVVNGNPPQVLTPPAPTESASPAPTESASPARTESAAPAPAESASPARIESAASELPTEASAEIALAEAALVVRPTDLPATPEQRDPLPSAPAQPACVEPEPDLAEATDPDAALAGDGELAADFDWEEQGAEPPPAVAHDALPPIPSSLLSPEPALPLSEGFASPPPQAELALSFGQDEPEEESTIPNLEPLPAPEPPKPEAASLAPLEPPESATEDEETTSPSFANELAFEDTPIPGAAADAPAAGPSGPCEGDRPALDFGGEPLEFDLGGEEAGEIETDLGFDADRYRSDAPLEFADSAPEPAPAPPTVRTADPSAEGFIGDLLRDLDDCTEGHLYRELAERAGSAAEKLAAEGLENDAYLVLRALVSHASDESKRPPEQREAANDHLRRLAAGPLLETLRGRACGEGDGSLEANQILVQLGSDVVVPLFRAAALERSAERRERLHGVLIAMGEEALPDLLRLMRDDDATNARSAVRLAGELQNPAAVGRLSELLESPSSALSQEVSKALVRIGDTTAVRALAGGLDSPVSHVPSIAAYALGASGSDYAVEALLGALHRAIVHGKTEFAREVIRSLGRLGRAEATPDLAAILLRRGLRQRRRHRELKLAAASALGRLPGDEAVGALAQAAQSRDAHIRRAAQIALDRRAQALAGSDS